VLCLETGGGLFPAYPGRGSLRAAFRQRGRAGIAVPEAVYFELDVARKVKEDRLRFEIEAEVHWEEPPPGDSG